MGWKVAWSRNLLHQSWQKGLLLTLNFSEIIRIYITEKATKAVRKTPSTTGFLFNKQNKVIIDSYFCLSTKNQLKITGIITTGHGIIVFLRNIIKKLLIAWLWQIMICCSALPCNCLKADPIKKNCKPGISELFYLGKTMTCTKTMKKNMRKMQDE